MDKSARAEPPPHGTKKTSLARSRWLAGKSGLARSLVRSEFRADEGHLGRVHPPARYDPALAGLWSTVTPGRKTPPSTSRTFRPPPFLGAHPPTPCPAASV